ncbi:tripartite tricarboxylate transporter substrate-binding protein [Variovorax sp. DT-64]|uniref:tripartite tricarboxylate transporter substrate-binding protein n=1 Tax=Variovorax sp. DT-64 TaxID=3396160 RepID=UPI003F1CEA37
MITRRTLLAGASAGITCVAFGSTVNAQAARPLRIVVGFPAGVLTDNIARALGEELRPSYPAGVIVENKVGAGGRIAAEFVKRADDGNTILLTPGFVMSIYPHVYSKPGYDALADFKPVSAVASFDYALTVGPAVPATVRTLPEYIQWCREDASRAKYGIPAAGSTAHFIGTLLAKATDVPFTVVPYKGGAPLIQDVLGGHIPAIIDPVSNALPYQQSGKLRVLAITGSKRSTLLPDVPTVVEYKMDSLVAKEVYGVFVPSTVPDARVQKLHEELAGAVEKVKGRFAALLVSPERMNPTELRAFTGTEYDRWKTVIAASGFKAEE